MEKIIVFGGGITGLMIALNLTLSGADVTVIEKDKKSNGASVRIGGVIHSGARFAAVNPKLAIRCAEERKFWGNFAKEFLKIRNGFFVATENLDRVYYENWMESLDKLKIAYERVEKVSSVKAKFAVKTEEALVDPVDLIANLELELIEHGATYLNHTEIISANNMGDGIYKIKLKRGNSSFIMNGILVNATGVNVPYLLNLITGNSIKYDIWQGSHLALNVKVETIIEKISPPGQADIIVPVENGSLITPTMVKPSNDRINEYELTTLLNSARELLGVNESNIIGYLTAPRLTYDASASIMETDLVRQDMGMVSAYSSNFACSAAVAVKVTELLSKKFNIKGYNGVRLHRLEKRNLKVEKLPIG
ncbi:MAG: FAD-dependent oxidoreductase [Nitrososphaeria archaeon]